MTGKPQILSEKFDISNEKSSEIVGKTRILLEKFDIRHGNHQKRSEKFDISNRNHRQWLKKLGFRRKSSLLVTGNHRKTLILSEKFNLVDE